MAPAIMMDVEHRDQSRNRKATAPDRTERSTRVDVAGGLRKPKWFVYQCDDDRDSTGFPKGESSLGPVPRPESVLRVGMGAAESPGVLVAPPLLAKTLADS